MTALDQFYGPNAGYVAELLERYQQDPRSVDPAVRETLATALAGPPVAAPAPPEARFDLSAAAAAAALVQGIRTYGHLAAHLDPLGSEPPGDPQLDPATYGIRDADLARLPAGVVGGPAARGAASAAEGIARLRQVYSGATGYEFGHIEDPEERAWLYDAVEEGRFRPPADPVDERRLLDRLTELSAFERFLHRAYPGQTRFSIEGLGMLIPMLDEAIDRAGETGTRTITLGMAHRGRLNVLAHVLGKPYERILGEFEGVVAAPRSGATEGTDEGWAGDVKYHAGGRRRYQTDDASGTLTVIMAPNPSHLECVNPVVEGMARAAESYRPTLPTTAPSEPLDERTRAHVEQPEAPGPGRTTALPVLIHGDASFPGQGIVAETLNLSRLTGYSTGGTLHVIANNQLGFTTNPSDGRSTLYASDLAKGFEIPIVHVNAQDPIACLAAIRLAVAYRVRFQKDFLVDLIGYRRWGHNEGDEPSFTQPALYALVASLPTVREAYAADLVKRGVVQAGEPEAFLKAGLDEFQRIREGVLAQKRSVAADLSAIRLSPNGAIDQPPAPETDTALPLETLRDLNEALVRFPEGFTLNTKLERPIQRRRQAFEQPDAPIDWGHAETLAFATILREGISVRLSGQDSARGTFSQRHLTFHDQQTGSTYTPLTALPDARATFEVWNSPLSEAAVMGFEYGYSVQAPRTLVLWEAQYGDFVNGAQVIVDEYVVSGQAKWGLLSGLVLLLPHAWEGQGPDHSSGRLERFLQLAAEENIRVANCTTAGQYYHLLRRQARLLRDQPRPLVVMTPKSLLRHPLAAARAADLAEGSFQPVLDDARAAERRDRVERVVLCSGKVWVDVESNERRAAADSVAVVRVEELYPYPEAEIRNVLERYPGAREVVWLQEEPRNMGAWTYLAPRLRPLLKPEQSLTYVGRPASASPAEGWSTAHAAEQRRIVDAVLQEVASYAG